MRIRAARPSDVSEIVAIEDEAFATDRLTARRLRRMLARGSCALLAAVDREGVAGYALVLLRRGGSRARLYAFAVRASARRRGLGAKLLAAAERDAARRGRRWMTLETARDNESAIKLYRSAGYRLESSLGPYYEDGSPADRFVKALAPSARNARTRDSCWRRAERLRSNRPSVRQGPGRSRARHGNR